MKMDPGTSENVKIKEEPFDHNNFLDQYSSYQDTTDSLEFDDMKVEPHYLSHELIVKEEEVSKSNDKPMTFFSTSGEQRTSMKMDPGTLENVKIKEEPFEQNNLLEQYSSCQDTRDPLELDDIKVEPHYPSHELIVKKEEEDSKQNEKPMAFFSTSGKQRTPKIHVSTPTPVQEKLSMAGAIKQRRYRERKKLYGMQKRKFRAAEAERKRNYRARKKSENIASISISQQKQELSLPLYEEVSAKEAKTTATIHNNIQQLSSAIESQSTRTRILALHYVNQQPSTSTTSNDISCQVTNQREQHPSTSTTSTNNVSAVNNAVARRQREYRARKRLQNALTSHTDRQQSPPDNTDPSQVLILQHTECEKSYGMQQENLRVAETERKRNYRARKKNENIASISSIKLKQRHSPSLHEEVSAKEAKTTATTHNNIQQLSSVIESQSTRTRISTFHNDNQQPSTSATSNDISCQVTNRRDQHPSTSTSSTNNVLAVSNGAARRQREYRARKRLQKPMQQENLRAAETERKRNYRARKKNENIASTSISQRKQGHSPSLHEEVSAKAAKTTATTHNNIQQLSSAIESQSTRTRISAFHNDNQQPSTSDTSNDISCQVRNQRDQHPSASTASTNNVLAVSNGAARRQREYRARKRLQKPMLQENLRAVETERKRNYRARKKNENIASTSISQRKQGHSPSLHEEVSAKEAKTTATSHNNILKLSSAIESRITRTRISAFRNDNQQSSTSDTSNDISCRVTNRRDQHPSTSTASTNNVSAVSNGAARRQREYRARKRVQMVLSSHTDPKATPDNTDPSQVLIEQHTTQHLTIDSPDISEHANNVEDMSLPYDNFVQHSASHFQFKKQFLNNNFGAICNICDRLWYETDVKSPPPESEAVLAAEFPQLHFKTARVCETCYNSLRKNRIPTLSSSNGFKYPAKPLDLPELDLITERLISPRLPFMQIRRLRHVQGQYGISGQVINVPVSVNNMAALLPRELDDDYCINVHIKQKKIHKSSYLTGMVKKRVVEAWLRFLVNTPLYSFYGVKVRDSLFQRDHDYSDNLPIDDLSELINTEESLTAQQQTLLWNEDKYLRIAPVENNTPQSIMFDEHCEELSFPSIYLGQFRTFKEGITVTPFMIATSELRRSDRRGVTPQHLLYVAMKILLLRTREALTVALKFIGKDTKLTRAQVESPDFINGCIETNLAFLRSIPNSTYYWSQRKRDLFAMIRQLGKPTFFLTMGANEMGWPKLMQLLYRLSKNGTDIAPDDLKNMHYNVKASLINNDPVTCAIHFNKLVNIIMKILESARWSPFGNHYVTHFFKRIEFQHGGSPHAHILLWLNEAPQDALSQDKINAETFIDKLVSVTKANSSGHAKLQTHKHTFTCNKNNKNTTQKACRFGAPFMPIRSTTILVPMPRTDTRRRKYSNLYKRMWKGLEEKEYENLDEFLREHKVPSDEMYLDILRAGISRPRVFLRREPAQKWINPYNPFILNVLGAKMELQFIIDEYSCAEYVVEYVNKTNRGVSNLQRKIIQTMDEHPEFDIVEVTRKLSVDMPNCVELTSQEAAWFLLRQPMSQSSDPITYIATSRPLERDRVRKTSKEIEAAGIDGESCDIWKENLFDKYKKRPNELEEITLAQAAANYTLVKGEWKTRRHPRIIRYRNYDIAADPNEYKREMVTLHLPFRDEETEILAENRFVQLYDDNYSLITKRTKEFESDLDIEKMRRICRELYMENDNIDEELANDVNLLATHVHDADPFAELLPNPNSDMMDNI